MKTVTETKIKKILLGSPLFKNCPDSAEIMAQTCETKNYCAGDVIVTPAEPATYVGIVLEGALQVYADGTGGKKLMRTLESGTLFGVVGLFDGQRYASLIVAKTNAAVLCLPCESVLQLMKTNGTFLENYVRFLTGRIRFLNRKIEYLSQGTAAARVAAYLLSLAPRDKVISGSVTVIPDYTATELSELLNLGRASLYRAFDTLGKDGLVIKNGGTYEITDVQKLQKILNKEV